MNDKEARLEYDQIIAWLHNPVTEAFLERVYLQRELEKELLTQEVSERRAGKAEALEGVLAMLDEMKADVGEST